MTKPWEGEPDRIDFEAEGLPCKMRRGFGGAWCGYVGIGPEHPLHGLPRNHLLKLPPTWFGSRRVNNGTGMIDLMIHSMNRKSLNEACEIALAFEVHGGITFAEDSLPHGERIENFWWFGFDCGHALDIVPKMLPGSEFIEMLICSLPNEVRETMRHILINERSVYRDQYYVVGECQSLAAQLIRIIPLISSDPEGEVVKPK